MRLPGALWRPSARLRELLARAGVSLSPGASGARAISYIQIGKWLVRVDTLSMFLRRRGASLAQISGAQLARFCIDQRADARAAQLLLAWDKEHCKVSMFDLDRRLKHVRWAPPRDMQRELEATRHFDEAGVPSAPLLDIDADGCRLTQALVGRLFANYAPLEGLRAALVRVHGARAGAMGEARRYLSARRERLGDMPHVDPAIARAAAACVDEQIGRLERRDTRAGALGVARSRAHGDATPHNSLRDDEGRVLLIDFDRSFEASVYYDFVCMHCTTPKYGRRALVADIRGLHRVMRVDDEPFDDETLIRHAASAFIVDAASYVHERACASPAAARFVALQIERVLAVLQPARAARVGALRRLYRAVWLPLRFPLGRV